MDKYYIAEVLRDIGTLIELGDPTPQKGIAYLKAARMLLKIKNLKEYIENKKLEEIPGVGQVIAKLVMALVLKQKLNYYDKLRAKVPVSLFELIHVPGLNARKVRLLYEQTGVKTLDSLQNLIETERLEQLHLFSRPNIRKIKNSLTDIQKHGHTLLYPAALSLAQSFVGLLKEQNLVKKISISGSLRRKNELISNLVFVAIASNSEACLQTFASHVAVREIRQYRKAQMTAVLKNGIEASLFLTDKLHFSYFMLLKTGNAQHISSLLKEAKKKKISLKQLQKVNDENDFYAKLKMDFIEPELRENKGEIEAAKRGSLPQLVEQKDLRGTFHCHTTDSDGIDTLEQLVAAAKKLGWQYLGISDHSKSSYQANGMDETRLLAQVEKIHHLNKKNKKFRIFSGTECDILKNGELDFSDEILKQLDFVIISVHRFFSMDKKAMTKRIIKAIENPYVTIMGHVTGRLLRLRDPYKVNMQLVIDACIANKKVMEINGTPSRMDMDWRFWIKAKEKGLLCSINPDAHSVGELKKNCTYGIQAARKGWLEKKDVINTMDLNEMQLFLKNRRMVS